MESQSGPKGGLPAALFDPEWQMPLGERAAVEGLISALKPRLAVEVGTAGGGSLRRIAAHSAEVHAFDLDLSRVAEVEPERVHLHEGDSRELLTPFLSGLDDAGRRVDFALIDGDHTTEGARVDVAAVIASPACDGCVALIHDTANPLVREGVRQAFEGARGDRPCSLDLDFVPGVLSLEPPFEGLWGGLGLLLVGEDQPLHAKRLDPFPLLDAEWEARRGLGPGPDGEPALLATLAKQRQWLQAMHESPSWRVTAPLRFIKRVVLGRRER